MKVSDVMQKHVDFVDSDTKILDVARIIFGRRINGLPVCEGKKVIGFISDTDILSKFHPTMQEFAEDPSSSSNFEIMEEKAQEILNLTARDIMNKEPITVDEDDHLLRADSIMRIKDVGRLPVVDKKGNLVGIISMGDIFKSLVGKKMPYLEGEEYHDWIAKHYDLAIGWESRLEKEISSLSKVFKQSNVKKVLDIGCGTGEHVIALAKRGFTVVGLENSRLMFNVAQEKWQNLPKEYQSKVKFIRGSYIDSLKDINEEFQAAIFMGNTLSHIHDNYMEVLRELKRILPQKNSIIVAQLINFEKAIKVNHRLVKFDIKKSVLSPEWEHAYYWFYDPPRKKGDFLVLNAAILDFNGRIWLTRGMNSVKTVPLPKNKLIEIFKKIGFSKTTFYGTKEWDLLFNHPFKPLDSDWLNVVAKR